MTTVKKKNKKIGPSKVKHFICVTALITYQRNNTPNNIFKTYVKL